MIGNEQLSAEDHAGRLKQRRRQLLAATRGEAVATSVAATGGEAIHNNNGEWRGSRVGTYRSNTTFDDRASVQTCSCQNEGVRVHEAFSK